MDNQMELIIPVVLAGGTGSRLWPLSRSSCPKQLLNLLGDYTLLQDTLLRCQDLPSSSRFIVYNDDYHFQVVEQVNQLGLNAVTFINEPCAKNTAPAIALAALEAQSQQEDAYLFVMPADHYLRFNHQDDLLTHLSIAKQLADQNYMVTFGVIPTGPESGYGYIQTGASLINNHAFEICTFIEKPCKEKAQVYFKDKNYYWNSGIFFFRASCYLNELQRHAPLVFDCCESAYLKSKKINNVVKIDLSINKCPSISIDYAVMEKTQSAAIIPLNASWSDVGSWSSIFDLKTKDQNGNVIEGDVVVEESTNCYLNSSHRLIAAVGLDNHIVIETRDSILVAHKDKCQDIKKIVERLASDQRIEISSHHKIFRPWGDFEILIDTPHYKVKRLTVKVGSSLSLQRHKHRSEHWVVVSGVATIINADEHLVLYPSQSTYIPQGAKHRLSNFSDQPLEIIEVQLGEYLGEDDIERFEDVYGRSEILSSVT